jgi:hypothetical protein
MYLSSDFDQANSALASDASARRSATTQLGHGRSFDRADTVRYSGVPAPDRPSRDLASQAGPYVALAALVTLGSAMGWIAADGIVRLLVG